MHYLLFYHSFICFVKILNVHTIKQVFIRPLSMDELQYDRFHQQE